VHQKDAEGGVVQNEREVDSVVAVFAGQVVAQAGLVVFRGEALEVQVFDRRRDFGVGGSKTLQDPFNLVVRPLLALVIRVENENRGRLLFRRPDRGRYPGLHQHEQKVHDSDTDS
jgi:hypothetical protein